MNRSSRWLWAGLALAFSSLTAYFAVALTVGFHGPPAAWAAYGEVPLSGPVAQPIGFWTDLGFICAGLFALGRLRQDAPSWMQRPTVYSIGFGLLIVWMGPASMLEHGTLTTTWGWFDATSIHWFSLWVLGYLVMRGIGMQARQWTFLVGEIAVWLALATYTWGHQDARQKITQILLGAVIVAVPPSLLWSSPPFRRTAWGWFGAVILAFSVAAVFLAGGAKRNWAAPWGHGVWHVLSAIAMYLSVRLLQSDGTGPATGPR